MSPFLMPEKYNLAVGPKALSSAVSNRERSASAKRDAAEAVPKIKRWRYGTIKAIILFLFMLVLAVRESVTFEYIGVFLLSQVFYDLFFIHKRDILRGLIIHAFFIA